MWPNPQETADLVTFTKEILNFLKMCNPENPEVHFLCIVKAANYFRKEASLEIFDRVLNISRCKWTESNLELK